MRDLLEELPHALLPDPARESEDPGVERHVQDDDLVRPAAEEDLPVDARRSKRSPLARHVDIVIDPFDPRLSTTVGLALAIEGQRVRSATIDIGMVHQAIERRAVGLAVDGAPLSALLALIEPAPVAGLAVALAVERLAVITADDLTMRWRTVLLDLVAVSAHGRVLSDALVRIPHLARRAEALVVAADAARDGLDVDHRFAHPGGLRHPVPDDELATLHRRVDDIHRLVGSLGADDVERALAHVRGAGVLDLERCRDLGIDGPTLTAAGSPPTLPTDLGMAPGLRIVDDSGCALARVLTRRAELDAAVARLSASVGTGGSGIHHRQVMNGRISGHVGGGSGVDAVDAVDFGTLTGTATSLLRGPGGTTAVFLVVEAGRVVRLRVRPPELPLLAGVTRALRGVRLDDVGEVIASFGLRASALDR